MTHFGHCTFARPWRSTRKPAPTISAISSYIFLRASRVMLFSTPKNGNRKSHAKYIHSLTDRIRGYGFAAIANACAHPILAGRAKELGALESMRSFLRSPPPIISSMFGNNDSPAWEELRRSPRASTAVARMSGTGLRVREGDIEEGVTTSSDSLPFFVYKWGGRPYRPTRLSRRAYRASVMFVSLSWFMLTLFLLYSVL